MKIEDSVKLDFCDVLIRPKRSVLTSRSEVTLEREFSFLWSDRKWKGIPIMTSNMDTVGTLSMVSKWTTFGMLGCFHKFFTPNEILEFFSEYPHTVSNSCLSIGMRDGDMEYGKEVLRSCPNLDMILIDVANGYSEKFTDYIKEARQTWPNHIIMAGNVVTAEMTEALLLAGADIVKIGIGSGSVCTTRKVAGVGYPQLSAIMECADAAHGMGGHIIADGGFVSPGDVSKAFGAGADFVMLGGMLSGHDECEGEVVEENDVKKMLFYGMSSETAMKTHYGHVASHRAPEGKAVYVPYRGSVDRTIQEILGGIRSACTYTGAKSLKNLPKCTTFIRVNRQLNTIFGN